MKTTKTVPEQQKEEIVTHIILLLGRKECEVITTNSDGSDQEGNTIDLTGLWGSMTGQQRTIVRGFVKAIGALGLKTESSEVDGDFMPDEIPEG